MFGSPAHNQQHRPSQLATILAGPEILRYPVGARNQAYNNHNNDINIARHHGYFHSRIAHSGHTQLHSAHNQLDMIKFEPPYDESTFTPPPSLLGHSRVLEPQRRAASATPLNYYCPSMDASSLLASSSEAAAALNGLPPPPAKQCLICAEKSDGAHFGVDSCRACAAFFRRSIVLKKKYVCRQGSQDCDINKSVRCMCRACRFRKCIRMGMTQEAVQFPRDHLGRRAALLQLQQRQQQAQALSQQAQQPLVDRAASAGSSSQPSLPAEPDVMASSPEETFEVYYRNIIQTIGVHRSEPSTSALMPVLRQLQRGYHALREKRLGYRINGREREGDIADPTCGWLHPPRIVNCRHADKLEQLDYPNILIYVGDYFPRLAELTVDQKKVLYNSFFSRFLFMESSYNTTLQFPGRTDYFVMCDGNYIDMANLETYFDGDDLLATEDASRLFGPSFELHIRNLLVPVQELRPSELELCALLSLTFFVTGLDGSSEEADKLCRSIQDQVFRELLYLYESGDPTAQHESPGLRCAQLAMLMPALHRVVSRHWEDLLISKLFTASYNEQLYKIFKEPKAETAATPSTPRSESDGGGSNSTTGGGILSAVNPSAVNSSALNPLRINSVSVDPALLAHLLPSSGASTKLEISSNGNITSLPFQ